MVKKRIKKSAEKVRELVPDNVAEQVANLKNPLVERPEDAPSLENVPRITNETIAVHREEVLKGARKYIYPLRHSKRRIVTLTISIVIATLLIFFVYSSVALYKLHQYNTFLYRATQVVPFPIARTGDTFIAYENYLFELRRYVHYYQNQLGRDFSGGDKPQLLQYRKQALDDVINNAYIKILAKQNNVSVSDKEIDARITQVRNQNRLGSNNKVFADVLRDYWGWSVSDFRRSLEQQILAEKVVAKLDKQDTQRAESALLQLKKGADFATLATQVSDDQSSKASGGDYGAPISKTNPNVPPQVIEALFKLQPGQISGVINTGSTLEIVKLVSVSGNTVVAKHIVFNLKDINTYIKPLKEQHPVHTYVNF